MKFKSNEITFSIYSCGNKRWYKNGQRHRKNGPAVIFTNGDKTWYQNSQRYGEYCSNGDKFWLENGKWIKSRWK